MKSEAATIPPKPFSQYPLARYNAHAGSLSMQDVGIVVGTDEGVGIGDTVGDDDGDDVGENVEHTAFLHNPALQSKSRTQPLSIGQDAQSVPPQSTSVSLPSFTPFEHVNEVGNTVGDSVGDIVGDVVGENVGMIEGDEVNMGEAEGDTVGGDVGIKVGTKVGETDGNLVGAN